MEKRLKRYLAYLDGHASQSSLTSEQRQAILNDLLVQIGFYQHERQMHLIVTATFAVLELLALLALVLSENILFAVVLLMVTWLLIPYIRHYYFLENGVHKLYDYYEKLSA